VGKPSGPTKISNVKYLALALKQGNGLVRSGLVNVTDQNC